jgi:peptide/nickel transport system permease protein
MLRAVAGPIITLAAAQFGYLLSGAAVTEMLFVRRGIGQLLLTAVHERDYPVVQGVVMLSAVVYSFLGAVADGLAALIDPRTRA